MGNLHEEDDYRLLPSKDELKARRREGMIRTKSEKIKELEQQIKDLEWQLANVAGGRDLIKELFQSSESKRVAAEVELAEALKNPRERLWKEYIDLLTTELSELISLATVHGWKSSRFAEGIRLRKELGIENPNEKEETDPGVSKS